MIALTGGKQFDAVYNDFLQQIHSGDLKEGMIHRGMMNQYANHFTDALMSELDFGNIESPQNRLATYIKSNIFQFSAAKTLAEHRAFAHQLIDADGNVKSFSQFRQDVESIAHQFNEDWLHTEYNNVIASAQAADKWADIEDAKGVLPWLEYRTMEDDRVRPEHAALDGKVARVDDAVWNTIYPPNDWGCRCTVLQLDNGEGTRQNEHSSLSMDEAKAIFDKNNREFKNNVGKTGMAFTPDTPTIALTNSGNINKWDAQDTYGLSSPEQISQRKNLPSRESTSGINETREAWQQNLKDAGIGDDRFVVKNDFTDLRVVFDQETYSHIVKNLPDGNHDVAGNVISVVRNADEVWVNMVGSRKYLPKDGQYYFVKYFSDSPVMVVARMNESKNYLEAITAYKLNGYESGKTLTQVRRGILMMAKK